MSNSESPISPLAFPSRTTAEHGLPEFVDLPFDRGIALASTTRAAGLEPSAVRLWSGHGAVGTLVLAEVIRLGAYGRLETATGREVPLRPGDRFVGVLAHRYSTHSLFGHVPGDGIPLPSDGNYDLLAVGGVIGRCTSHPAYLGPPTKVRLLGGLADERDADRPLCTMARVASFADAELRLDCQLILVCGTAAEVGKTTFASNLVHHLVRRRGKRVAVTKLAGTGRLRDLYALAVAGAGASLDFVDGGLATTYDVGGDVTAGVARGILNRLAATEPDCIVAECGGDTLGAHVDAILADPQIQAGTSALVIVPSDAVAAYGAAGLLRRAGYPHEPWFAMPIKNVSAARWRARQLLGDRMIDVGCEDELDRLEASFSRAAAAA